MTKANNRLFAPNIIGVNVKLKAKFTTGMIQYQNDLSYIPKYRDIPRSKYKIGHTIEKVIDGGVSSDFFKFLYHSPSALYNKDDEDPKIKGDNVNATFDISILFVFLSINNK